MNTSRRPESDLAPPTRRSGEASPPKGNVSFFESEEPRLVFFTRLLAISILLCLAFSSKLWISRPFYPLVPFWGIVPAFPHPMDEFFRAWLVAVLLAVAIRPRSKIWTALALVTFAILFLQDQNRLWPSFYQFFFLLLILVTIRHHAGKSDAPRLLAGIRFITAAIYFWSGVQKLNTHFFNEEFPSIVQPLTGLLPFEISFLPTVGIFAALFEVFIGIGLLTKRFRNIALYEAMLLHLVIFFCIGPFRDNWNNSAWMWGLAVAAQTWVLFFKAPAFDFKTMFGAPWFCNIPQALAVVLIGIVPVLNNVNRWDSALSFNVYTGNVNYAEIVMRPDVVDQLPEELVPFVSVYPNVHMAVLNLNAWTAKEFNANPYPEKRIFRAVLRAVCGYLPEGSAWLYFREKSSWFSPQAAERYDCEKNSCGKIITVHRPPET